jgi:hypothetical protein
MSLETAIESPFVSRLLLRLRGPRLSIDWSIEVPHSIDGVRLQDYCAAAASGMPLSIDGNCLLPSMERRLQDYWCRFGDSVQPLKCPFTID